MNWAQNTDSGLVTSDRGAVFVLAFWDSKPCRAGESRRRAFARHNCTACAHSASNVAAVDRQCAAAARTAGIQTQSPVVKARRLPLGAPHPTGVGRQPRPVPMRWGDYGPRNRATQPHYPHCQCLNKTTTMRRPACPAAGKRPCMLEDQHTPAWDRKGSGACAFPERDLRHGDATVILIQNHVF